MEWINEEYHITDDPEKVDLDVVCELLGQSYWAAKRPREKIAKSIAGSINFSVYHQGKQVGFARVVTDQAAFAWICDVIIAAPYRGKGLGKWLMACVVNYPAIQGTQQLLRTSDAHGLYERFGFERQECMVRRG
jgi:GNAT superfamily N-acetyltransferase